METTIKTILALCLFGTLVACNNHKNAGPTVKAPIEVEAVPVSINGIKEFLTFNGVTQYQKKESIRANITGYISWLPFERGDTLKKGQTFALVRTKEQVALAEAIKIDSSLAKFSKPITIASNATGVITTLNVVVGDYIAEGDVLAVLARPKTLAVKVNVPFAERNTIGIGTACEIILPNGQSIQAKITSILPVMDQQSQSQSFLIALPDEDLPENLNVLVKTVSKKDPAALSIPREALQTNALLTDFWVMKVVRDTLAIKQTVVPLLENDSLVQIKSDNLKKGDMVVTKGSYQMRDSTYIKIMEQ